MTRTQFVALMETEGIESNAFSVESPLRHESYCLARERVGWSVFYFERGKRHNVRHFDYETDAFEYLAEVILEDGTTRRRD